MTIEYIKITHVFRLEYKRGGRQRAIGLIGAAGGYGCSADHGCYSASDCEVEPTIETALKPKKLKVKK